VKEKTGSEKCLDHELTLNHNISLQEADSEGKLRINYRYFYVYVRLAECANQQISNNELMAFQTYKVISVNLI